MMPRSGICFPARSTHVRRRSSEPDACPIEYPQHSANETQQSYSKLSIAVIAFGYSSPQQISISPLRMSEARNAQPEGLSK
jgi:hypothetical protein